MLKQVDVVRNVVGVDLPVLGVLCFVDAEWPLLGGSFATRGVEALWPKKLCRTLKADGHLEVDKILDVHRILAAALPIGFRQTG